jgi:hypothetical protein
VATSTDVADKTVTLEKSDTSDSIIQDTDNNASYSVQRLSKTTYYDADSSVTASEEYEYDTSGRLISMSYYDADGEKSYTDEYISGIKVKRIRYESGKVSYISEYTYDDDFNLLSTVDYDADGNEYLLEENESDENDDIQDVYDTEVDGDGNIIKGTYYDTESGDIISWYENEYIDIEYDNPIVEYESPLGYTIEYFSDMFSLTSDDTSDRFEYTGGWDLKAPVYVAVQLITDMDAKTVADGVALQSGQDGAQAEACTFGSDVDGYRLDYIEERENIRYFYSFFAVPKGDGCLLMEVGEYLGIPGFEIDGSLEIMIDSFIPMQD